MRPRRAARRASLLAAGLLAVAGGAWGCLGRGDFRCTQHAQCGGAGSFCESNGRCSAPDDRCGSRRRFVANAGSDGDTCVPSFCTDNPIRALAVGGAHACILRADASVSCWGRNDDGQVGDGTRTPRSLPVTVAGIGGAIAIAAGQRHSCAVRTGGTVVCWGANDTGQLGGDVVGASLPEPQPVLGVTGAASLAAGLDFSCAVLADGTVRCWGADNAGQLGDDDLSPPTRLATPVAFLDGVRSVSAFWQHACARRSDDTMWCWGANGKGQIGNGTTLNQIRPVRVVGLTAVTAVGTGQEHSCAVTRADGLYCWGDNAASQLGSTLDGPVTAPSRVPIVTDPIAVSVGLQHTCAIRNGGAVYCWGQNDRGQLGVGTFAILSSPVEIPSLQTGVALAGGTAFSCARTQDGAVFCWGDNHHGQLGIGSGVVRPTPVDVANVAGALRISTGTGHTCAAVEIEGSRVPMCWGANQAGQLGDGTRRIDRAVASLIEGDIGATAIAAGGAHTCAIDPLDTRMWCWGRGSAGQLGSTPLADKPPSQVPTLTGVTAIAAGGTHTCAIAAGTVHCFGANTSGQLGDGTQTDRAPPAATAALGSPAAAAVEITAGGAHTCAADQSGKLWCWGRADEGQLGDGGSATTALAPVAVTLGPVNARPGVVSAGGAHTCAVTDAGELACWGRGSEGQTGPSSSAPALPRMLTAVADARAVAAGGAHTCAIAGDAGLVWCFGANDHGQLGSGTTGAPRATPGMVDGLQGVDEISAGALHTCVRRRNGTVACWGADTSGQLGDGVALTLPAPQLARITCQ